jgi:hypothetical protein
MTPQTAPTRIHSNAAAKILGSGGTTVLPSATEAPPVPAGGNNVVIPIPGPGSTSDVKIPPAPAPGKVA